MEKPTTKGKIRHTIYLSSEASRLAKQEKGKTDLTISEIIEECLRRRYRNPKVQDNNGRKG